MVPARGGLYSPPWPNKRLVLEDMATLQIEVMGRGWAQRCGESLDCPANTYALPGLAWGHGHGRGVGLPRLETRRRERISNAVKAFPRDNYRNNNTFGYYNRTHLATFKEIAVPTRAIRGSKVPLSSVQFKKPEKEDGPTEGEQRLQTGHADLLKLPSVCGTVWDAACLKPCPAEKASYWRIRAAGDRRGKDEHGSS